MNISIDNLHKVFPKHPFECKFSRECIDAVKNNDLSLLEYYWCRNKYVLNQHDLMKQTPLHWATKRNYIDIAKFLIKNGSNVNA